jgi:phosphohistidine phosphatase
LRITLCISNDWETTCAEEPFMTRVYIVRHARAASALPAMRDFDRPLDPVGRAAAGNLGIKLSEIGLHPDAIICSPSLRTRQTLEGIDPYFGQSIPTTFDQKLYTEEWPEYLEIIRATSATNSVMIIGHNPSCEDIVHQLAGQGDKKAMRQLLDGFAPGTLAEIEFDKPFSEIAPKSGYLKTILLDGCAPH